jgi:hypothetical protein
MGPAAWHQAHKGRARALDTAGRVLGDEALFEDGSRKAFAR